MKVHFGKNSIVKFKTLYALILYYAYPIQNKSYSSNKAHILKITMKKRAEKLNPSSNANLLKCFAIHQCNVSERVESNMPHV